MSGASPAIFFFAYPGCSTSTSGVQYFPIRSAVLPHPGAVLPHPGAVFFKILHLDVKVLHLDVEVLHPDVEVLHSGCESTAHWMWKYCTPDMQKIWPEMLPTVSEEQF